MKKVIKGYEYIIKNLQKEIFEIVNKIKKLEKFIESNEFNSISRNHKELLIIQKRDLLTLLSTLDARLYLFQRELKEYKEGLKK